MDTKKATITITIEGGIDFGSSKQNELTESEVINKIFETLKNRNLEVISFSQNIDRNPVHSLTSQEPFTSIDDTKQVIDIIC